MYSLQIDIKEGQKIIRGEDYNSSEAKDGYLYVIDKNSIVLDEETGEYHPDMAFEIEPAWAKDSNGEAVPTHYVIDGNTIKQVIEFRKDTAFPVVADPTVNPTVTKYTYKKVNVKYSHEWTKPKKCSAQVKARKGETGTLICNTSVSVSGSVSGTIKGIVTIGVGSTYTANIGHTITFKGPATRYMTYSVKKKIEKGTRKQYNATTGKLVSSNAYTVKKPVDKKYATKDA